ncbi:uncharacterized domain TIGR03067 protein [Singulisphaera sp. GP187]|uniref:TIGR03067 domain-containing protein n=1 Tax=Singulisphaera sp. GP187 TaxID=1882752 RepID=UPI0009265E1D|nr:TIGR03067 domain-containing protein [Singulisphaera sp. GP187]SIN81942.1 uncharacterized domain TIGR03067 protein [Singulisphaera sp. GP187]
MRLSIPTLVLGFLVPVFATGDDGIVTELKAIAGNWRVVHFEHKGKVAPDGDAKASLAIEAGGKAVLKPQGGEIRFTLSVDPSKSPKQITLTYDEGPLKDAKQFGIYKLEGTKLTICMAPPKRPEIERPEGFTTEEKDRTLVIHERVDEGK